MPRITLTVTNELNEWLMTLVDGHKRKRGSTILTFLASIKNGLIYEGETRGGNIRPIKSGDLQSMIKQGEQRLKAQISNTDKDAQIGVFFTPLDVLAELKERLAIMNNPETKATIRDMREEQQKILDAMRTNPPPPPPKKEMNEIKKD